MIIYKKLFFKILLLCLIVNKQSYAISCGGTCGGCIGILPLIEAAKEEISKAFDDSADRISARYALKVIPLMEGNKKLHRELAKIRLSIEAMEREKILVNEEIVSVLGEIKSLEFTETTKKQKNKKRK